MNFSIDLVNFNCQLHTMKYPEIPQNEKERLEALKKYAILDTVPEDEYDEITHLASQICNMPISLIDDKRQWFKSYYGTNIKEAPREISLCAHAINNKDNVFVVVDTRKDERFSDNPLVVNEPHIISYVGVPLVNKEGFALGTLCVMDTEINSLDEFQLKSLKILANQVLKLFELRSKEYDLNNRIFEMEIRNKGLEKFANTVAHDMRSPLGNMMSMAEIFQEQYKDLLDEDGRDLLQLINNSSKNLMRMVDGILAYSKNANLLSQQKNEINLRTLIENVVNLVDPKKHIKLNILPQTDPVQFFSNQLAIERIFMNLIDNSIKYQGQETLEIEINIQHKENNLLEIHYCDNGIGIQKSDYERVFEVFETTTNINTFGNTGTGIGLASVKTLIEGLGGTICLVDNHKKGVDFKIELKKT